jgi:hypothetical protein
LLNAYAQPADSTGSVAGTVSNTATNARVLHNMTGSYIAEYSAASPAWNLYRFRMDRVNLGLAYQLRPAVSLTCDINTLFNEPRRLYRGIPDRMARTIINGTTINVGVSGWL